MPLDGGCPGSCLFVLLFCGSCEPTFIKRFFLLVLLREPCTHKHTNTHTHTTYMPTPTDAHCCALPLFYDGSTFKQIFSHRTPAPFNRTGKKGCQKCTKKKIGKPRKFKYFLLRCAFHLPVSLKFMTNKIGIFPKTTVATIKPRQSSLRWP